MHLVHSDIVAGAIALVWLVGMTNAFNLLDNMDGLAATLAAIAFAFFAIDAVSVHPSDTVLALALAVRSRARASCLQPSPAREGARLHGRLRLAGARVHAGGARAVGELEGGGDQRPPETSRVAEVT